MWALAAQGANGAAIRCLECPEFQTDRLTGWPPLMVNNATLHTGQLPIRKTAETQRGGSNQCVTGTALFNAK